MAALLSSKMRESASDRSVSKILIAVPGVSNPFFLSLVSCLFVSRDDSPLIVIGSDDGLKALPKTVAHCEERGFDASLEDTTVSEIIGVFVAEPRDTPKHFADSLFEKRHEHEVPVWSVLEICDVGASIEGRLRDGVLEVFVADFLGDFPATEFPFLLNAGDVHRRVSGVATTALFTDIAEVVDVAELLAVGNASLGRYRQVDVRVIIHREKEQLSKVVNRPVVYGKLIPVNHNFGLNCYTIEISCALRAWQQRLRDARELPSASWTRWTPPGLCRRGHRGRRIDGSEA